VMMAVFSVIFRSPWLTLKNNPLFQQSIYSCV
jgi:hypothetical protein